MAIFRDVMDGDEVVVSGEVARKEFVDYVLNEMDNARSNLSGRFKKCEKWRRMREAIPEVKVKNSPFPNASNVVTPLAMWLSNTVYGELYNTFAVRDPFWTIRAMYEDNDLIEQARVLTKYMGLIANSPNDLNLRVKNNVIHYDSATLGTCYVKYPYVTKKWKVMKENEGGIEEPINVTMHNGIDIVTYMEEDVLFPSGVESVQNSPWFACIDYYYEHELRMMQESGTFSNVDDVVIKDLKDSSWTENKKSVSRDMGIDIDEDDGMYGIAEVYAYWDVDGDGVPEDIIVSIHLGTGIVVNEQFNSIGMRPIGVSKYKFIPYQLQGVGTCHMAEHMQDESDMIHNIRIDNNRLANMNPIQAKRSAGIKPNEGLSPGKIIWVDEIGDVAPLKLAYPQYASINEENLATTYAQRATGISEIMAGFSDSTLKSRDTLGGQMMRLQQGKGMFSAVVDNMGDFYSEMGLIVFYQLVHNRSAVMEKEANLKRLSEEELEVLGKALNIKMEEIPMKLQFKIKAMGVDETKDVQRQNLMVINQMLTQYTQEAVQAAMMLGQDQGQLPEMVRSLLSKGLEGKTRIIESMLELLNIDKTSDYIVNADVIAEKEQQMQMQKMLMAMQGQMQAQMGGVSGETGNVPGAGGGPGQAGPGVGGGQGQVQQGNVGEEVPGPGPTQ